MPLSKAEAETLENKFLELYDRDIIRIALTPGSLEDALSTWYGKFVFEVYPELNSRGTFKENKAALRELAENIAVYNSRCGDARNTLKQCKSLNNYAIRNETIKGVLTGKTDSSGNINRCYGGFENKNRPNCNNYQEFVLYRARDDFNKKLPEYFVLPKDFMRLSDIIWEIGRITEKHWSDLEQKGEKARLKIKMLNKFLGSKIQEFGNKEFPGCIKYTAQIDGYTDKHVLIWVSFVHSQYSYAIQFHRKFSILDSIEQLQEIFDRVKKDVIVMQRFNQTQIDDYLYD